MSEKGHLQVEDLMKLGFWEDVDVVYSSSELKSIVVAERISREFDIDHFLDVRLGEADRSNAKVVPHEEYMTMIKQAYANPNKSINNWETHHSMREQNIEVVEEIVAKHAGKNIVIIGHGGGWNLRKMPF